ncbi:MAG: S1/P1 nuclease [Planctomycetes bacterium]|nr:S1/P1 nuclease [Planctomycetota bacterium]
MTNNRPRFAAIVFLLAPTLCLAWGEDGHRIVGEIASHYLSPCTEEAVKSLLGDQTLADVSTWADEIKSDRKWDWAKPLHYANVTPGSDSFDLDRDCPEVGCVVSAIERFSRVLRTSGAARFPQPTKKEQVEALKFLIHLVGDLHQPLHVSRARDRGGNDIAVEFFNNRTNLHSLWDSGLIRHTKKPWSEYAAELRAQVKGVKTRYPRTNGKVTEWATESYRLALSNAYDVPKDGKLGQASFDRNIPIVDERLKMAGVHLAALVQDRPYSPKSTLVSQLSTFVNGAQCGQ